MIRELTVKNETYIGRDVVECPRCGSRMRYSNMPDKTVYRQCHICKLIQVVQNIETPTYLPVVDSWKDKPRFDIMDMKKEPQK